MFFAFSSVFLSLRFDYNETEVNNIMFNKVVENPRRLW